MALTRVVNHLGQGLDGCLAGDVDDGPRVATKHPGHQRPAEPDHAHNVCLIVLEPDFVFELEEVFDAEDTCIVDQDFNRREGFELLQHLIRSLRAGKIAPDGFCRFDLVPSLDRTGFRATVHNYIGALPNKVV